MYFRTDGESEKAHGTQSDFESSDTPPDLSGADRLVGVPAGAHLAPLQHTRDGIPVFHLDLASKLAPGQTLDLHPEGVVRRHSSIFLMFILDKRIVYS